MMKALILTFLVFPLLSFAQWKTDLSLSIDGETWKKAQVELNQDKESVIDFSRHQLKLSLQRNKQEGGVDVAYLIQAKGTKGVVTIAKGTENIDDSKASEIYAKGEPGQPNSIITFKFYK